MHAFQFFFLNFPSALLRYNRKKNYIYLRYKICFFNYFNWKIITLQYRHFFLPYMNMNWPQVDMCPPHPELSSHLHPHPTLLGSPSAPALGDPLHACNLHWSSILHTVMYMFQWCSLKSSYPHLLPLSPKVCSLHLCCPACRIISTDVLL